MVKPLSSDGRPGPGEWRTAYDPHGDAMTQAVTMSQDIRWQFARLRMGLPPPELDNAPTGSDALPPQPGQPPGDLPGDLYSEPTQ